MFKIHHSIAYGSEQACQRINIRRNEMMQSTGKSGGFIVKRLFAAMSCVALAGALNLAGTTPVQAEGSLHIYNWGDYINPEVLKRFSKKYDVKVSLDTYGTNEEMLAKIQAGAKNGKAARRERVGQDG